MFVTGLQFIPIHGEGPPISSSSEAAVVSISVDNKVCIHSLQYRRTFVSQMIDMKKIFRHFATISFFLCCISDTIPAWVAIVCIIVTVFLSFVFCSYIGI